MTKKQLAIIGNGLAGGRLLEELLQRRATERWDITVYGEEPHGSYNRILLAKVLGGASPESITLKNAEWYAKRGIRFAAGVKVNRLDTDEKVLYAFDGRTQQYDAAVFASGSKALVPPTDGLLDKANGALRPGAFVFRTVDDCLKVRQWAKPGARAAVIGGGLLGLEAAKGLKDLGLDVTVVHLADWLMDRQLDRSGGAMLRAAIETAGIRVLTGTATKKVLGTDKVTGLWFAGGTSLDADLVVFACGIRPRIDAAEASGVPVNKAIVVDDSLATKVPGVYALGECAEHRGQVYGIVAPIFEQAKVLADVLASDPAARFIGAKVYTRLKVAGVEVAGMGLTEPELPTDEVVQIIEERRKVYRKLIVGDGKLAGAMLVGDAEAAAPLLQIFDRGELLPENRLDLLGSMFAGEGTSGIAGGDPEICNCNRVSESVIVGAVRNGCRSLELLAECTRAGTGCGSCRGRLAQLILRHSPKVPAIPQQSPDTTKPAEVSAA